MYEVRVSYSVDLPKGKVDEVKILRCLCLATRIATESGLLSTPWGSINGRAKPGQWTFECNSLELCTEYITVNENLESGSRKSK